MADNHSISATSILAMRLVFKADSCKEKIMDI